MKMFFENLISCSVRHLSGSGSKIYEDMAVPLLISPCFSIWNCTYFRTSEQKSSFLLSASLKCSLYNRRLFAYMEKMHGSCKAPECPDVCACPFLSRLLFSQARHCALSPSGFLVPWDFGYCQKRSEPILHGFSTILRTFYEHLRSLGISSPPAFLLHGP